MRKPKSQKHLTFYHSEEAEAPLLVIITPIQIKRVEYQYKREIHQKMRR